MHISETLILPMTRVHRARSEFFFPLCPSLFPLPPLFLIRIETKRIRKLPLIERIGMRKARSGLDKLKGGYLEINGNLYSIPNFW